MSLEAFDHYTLSCSDVDATWRFYQDALGLKVTERVGFPIKAAIVWIGDTQVVHMFQSRPEANEIFARIAPKDEETKPFPTGRILHVEFWAKDLVAHAQAARDRRRRVRGAHPAGQAPGHDGGPGRHPRRPQLPSG